jgi:hypothetical protein
MLKTLGKWLFGAIILFVIGFTVIYFVFTRSMPDGVEGAKAEALTNKMLRALNHAEYKKLKTISWTYRDQNHYKWNKQDRNVLVSLPDVEVLLDFETDAHQVLRSGVSDSVAISQAISNFYNDSFWLAAPFKIKEKGTTRKYVETKDGPGILVTYASGGVTPGDSYLWVLDENYRPKYWRIWTSNVRIPGLKFEWSNWQQINGVWFATSHPGPGPVSIDITDLEAE